MIEPRNCWSSKPPSAWRGGDRCSTLGASAAGGGGGGGCRCRWGAGAAQPRVTGGRTGAAGGGGGGGGGGRRSSGGQSASPGESTSAPGAVAPSMDQQAASPPTQARPKTLTLPSPKPSPSARAPVRKFGLVYDCEGVCERGREEGGRGAEARNGKAGGRGRLVRWRKTWEGFSFPVKNLRDLGDFRWGGEDGGGACQPRQRPWVATRHNRSEAEARQAGRRTGQRKGGCGGAVPFFLPAPRPRRMVALVPLPSRSSVAFPPAAAVRLWAVGRCAGDGEVTTRERRLRVDDWTCGGGSGLRSRAWLAAAVIIGGESSESGREAVAGWAVTVRGATWARRARL